MSSILGYENQHFPILKKNEILKQMVQPKPRFVMLIVFDNILQL